MIPASSSNRPARTLAVVALAAGLSGCFGGNEHEITPPRPAILSFTATPSTVAPGGSTVLAWNVTGADTVTIAPGIGQVTGTTITIRPVGTTTYVLSARNAGGTSSTSVTVTVGAAPPAGLTYAQNPATYTAGVAITPNVPSSSGGAVVSYAVSPDLPTGLSLDPATGIISGTPAIPTDTAAYTVTATNATGSTTAALTITVVSSGLPAIVSFTAAPAAIAAGEASVLSWNVLGASLLSIDQGVGPVTGTSVTVRPVTTTTYRLSASNTLGTVTATVTVSVGTGAPANLRYTNATYVVGTAIPANTPTSTGGAILAYAVAPPLPAGLSLDTTTGVISGTPTAVTASATYVVTGTNLSGSTTASVVLAVTAAPTPGLPVIRRFSAAPGSIIDGDPTLLSWDVQDATSLVIEPFIGEVTGSTELEYSPTSTTTFTLAATNALGTTSASVTVTVSYLPPANLVYPTNPATYVVGTPITPNVPTIGGGVVFTCTAPGLPAGLSVHPTTCTLSGTPTAVAPTATYAVTATNPGGSTAAALVLTVNLPPLAVTTQPADRSVLPPSTASFSVEASGLPPLSYQWRRNGSDIAGATSSTYTTGETSAADAGAAFDVVVTDAVPRSVTSASAILSLRGFYPTGAMSGPRTGHTATLLDATSSAAAGKVLVAGGNSGAASLRTAELYDPATGTFAPTGDMNVARQGHSAVELADGRVLVVGGCTAGAGACTAYLDSAEIYDPALGTFAAVADVMASPRTDFAAVRVGTQVLVAGGFWYDPITTTETFLPTAELFEPVTGVFAPVSPMGNARRYPMAALLPDGTVLVAGGTDAAGTLATAEIFDPNGFAFVGTASMAAARKLGTATPLASGQVLVAGGLGATLLSGAERYLPSTSTFAATGALNLARALQSATGLASGEVLVAGGTGGDATAEIYDPVAGVFTTAPSMATARSGQTATRLRDGTVLVTGGVGTSGVLPSAERWAPYPGP